MIRIRNTEEKDIENIYKNLNLSYVKKYFRGKEKIQEKIHIDWYKFLIFSSEHILFTIEEENKENSFLGLLRFDICEMNENAEIFLYLLECIRNKNYSSKIISTSIEKIKLQYPQIKIIKACILEENINSITCFEKNNFILKGQIKKDGIEYLLYEKKL